MKHSISILATIFLLASCGKMNPNCDNPGNIAVTGEYSDLTPNSVTLYGWCNQKGEEGNSVIYGVEYSSTDLAIEAKKIFAESKDLDNKFCCTLTKLLPNTKYYYRSFVYFNGVKSFGEVKTFTTPIILAEALMGEFSISATKKVHFSQGNLVATIDASGVPTAWKFATNQYDYLGAGGANKTIGASAGDVDLFGWSTESTTYGINTSATSGDYSGEFYDWGKTMADENIWRTLSTKEWQYLINNDGAENIRKDKYKYGVSVCGKTNCVILLPDNWTWGGTVGETWQDGGYSEETTVKWSAMETAGAVCLPAAGNRLGSNVFSVGDYGFYWSSSAYGENSACSLYFYSSDVSPNLYDSRSYGYSVRLVTEANVLKPSIE